MKKTEFQFIQSIRRLQNQHPGIVLGIGDDAALLRHSGSSEIVVAADMLLDGVHFDLDRTPPALAGRKAIAVNLSDFAAMAAIPRCCFVSLAIPRVMADKTLDDIWSGLQRMAHEFEVSVAGGDTNVWDAPFAISVTMTGDCGGRQPVLRQGARPGDWIMVTGELGGSFHGRHLTFTPRVHEALWLRKNCDLTSMIDLSDGLSSDLHHLLDESRVGADILAWRIPISTAAQMESTPEHALERALSDGEDFELLFTLPAEQAQKLTRTGVILSGDRECPVHHIGTIRSQTGCSMHHELKAAEELQPGGWVHGTSDRSRHPQSRPQ